MCDVLSSHPVEEACAVQLGDRLKRIDYMRSDSTYER